MEYTRIRREVKGKNMIEKIIKRDGKIVDFDKRKITFAVLRAAISCGGRDKIPAERVTDDVAGYLEKREFADNYPTVEEVQDLVEKCLIERGHAKTAKAYILYRYEHALKRAGKESLAYSSENIPYRKLWQALSWAVDNSCVYIEQMRAIVGHGKTEELIGISENFYDSEIANAVEDIEKKIDDVKLLIIAGPSASGKTTTTIKISEALGRKNRTLKPINIDNYFFNLADHPKDSRGDYDFETPQALDLGLINKHLKSLLHGETIEIPRYDFKKGKRSGLSGTMHIGPSDIILIDSLHGMYGEMTADIPVERKYKIYVETLAQVKDKNKNFIRWSDIRMMRRMVRDMQFRNYSAKETVAHWRYVRRSELRNIVPKLREAHTVINTFLPYELIVLKQRLKAVFDLFIEDFKTDPELEDALERSIRVRNLLLEIPDWDGENKIPNDSLIREFIGGSIYSY
jgi:uridine kinase